MNDLVFFVSDLHGQKSRYEELFKQVLTDSPSIVMLGGDIMPRWTMLRGDFFHDYLFKELDRLKQTMGDKYPSWLIILGNDDPRAEELSLMEAEKNGVLHYMNLKKLQIGEYTFYGYSFIPPTPFLLKDWEKYDVGTYVDPGCTHPTEGFRSVETQEDIRFTNIATELNTFCGEDDLTRAVFLFHAPPYNTNLDRAALDGKMVDYVPLDVHIGSIAIQRFIESRQPYITLHGHVHESSRITGFWQENIGRTISMTAAFDGPELALIKFNLSEPAQAQRLIL